MDPKRRASVQECSQVYFYECDQCNYKLQSEELRRNIHCPNCNICLTPVNSATTGTRSFRGLSNLQIDQAEQPLPTGYEYLSDKDLDSSDE